MLRPTARKHIDLPKKVLEKFVLDISSTKIPLPAKGTLVVVNPWERKLENLEGRKDNERPGRGSRERDSAFLKSELVRGA